MTTTGSSSIPLFWKQRRLVGVSGIIVMCLITALGLTLYSWRYSSEQQFEQAQSIFDSVALDTEQALLHRFVIYSRALDGAAAYYDTSQEVDQSEWRDYVAKLKIDENLPGMNGIGFFFAVAEEDLEAFRATVEREGPPELAIHPVVDVDEHFIIRFIEPLDRNMEALGLDLAFEEGRRNAILRSRSTGATSLTQPIMLVQDQKQGAGFLLIRPIMPADGTAVSAWSYSPLIAEDFIGGLSPREGEDYALEIIAVGTNEGSPPIYRTALEEGTPVTGRYRHVEEFDYAGQSWRLQWTSLPAFERRVASNEPTIVLLGGLVITVLLGALLSLFLRREATIRRKIDEGTREIGKLARERERALERLNDSHRLLLMTEATAHVGHWHLNTRTNELYWSDEVYRIHGLDPDKPLGLENALEAYHPDDRERVRQAIEESDRTGEPYGFSARIYRTDGALRHVESIAQAELDEEGNTVALFGVFADRTDEVILRDDLRAARDTAEQAAQAKSAFLANMSHEIRTPMNGVLGFAQLLAEADLAPEQHQQATMILQSGKNMMHLLNDILDLSKVEAGRISLVSEPVDVRDKLSQSIELFRPVAENKGLEVTLTVAEEVPQWIEGDRLRMRQIIGNLLSNAVKFTEQGQVAVEARMAEGEWGPLLRIAVRDTGIGIAEDDLTGIFEGFSQADAEIHRRFGGTGLGLAISRNLARLMGGDLTVESRVGEGSTFILAVPMREAQAVEVEPAMPEVHESMSFAGRVLVAEDNEINQMLLAAMLEKLGVPFVIAPDGEQAVAMVEEAEEEGSPFDLVLMDIEMPRMDGYQASRVLRDSGYSESRLAIVALTANAFAEDKVKAIGSGMQDHLVKPITLEALKAVLESNTRDTA